jgi:hypothetical protein
MLCCSSFHQGLTNIEINTNISGRSIKMLSVKGVYENCAVKLKGVKHEKASFPNNDRDR